MRLPNTNDSVYRRSCLSFRHDLDDPETVVVILTEPRGMYIGEEIAISGRKGCRASKEVLEEIEALVSEKFRDGERSQGSPVT